MCKTSHFIQFRHELKLTYCHTMKTYTLVQFESVDKTICKEFQ